MDLIVVPAGSGIRQDIKHNLSGTREKGLGMEGHVETSNSAFACYRENKGLVTIHSECQLVQSWPPYLKRGVGVQRKRGAEWVLLVFETICWREWAARGYQLHSESRVTRGKGKKTLGLSHCSLLCHSDVPRTRVQICTRAKNSAPKEEERSLLDEAFADLLGVVNLLFMPNWGCFHLSCEWIMSTGENTRPTDAFVVKRGQCGSNCYVCLREHRGYMLPIAVRGTICFLSTDAFHIAIEKMNPITFENCSELTKILTESFDHRKMVFDIKIVLAYSVNSFFFQLIATYKDSNLCVDKQWKEFVLCVSQGWSR